MSGGADKPDDTGDTASKVKDISEVASGNQGRLGKIMGAAGKIATIYAGYEAAEELYGAVVGDTIKNFTDNHGLFLQTMAPCSLPVKECLNGIMS